MKMSNSDPGKLWIRSNNANSRLGLPGFFDTQTGNHVFCPSSWTCVIILGLLVSYVFYQLRLENELAALLSGVLWGQC